MMNSILIDFDGQPVNDSKKKPIVFGIAIRECLNAPKKQGEAYTTAELMERFDCLEKINKELKTKKEEKYTTEEKALMIKVLTYGAELGIVTPLVFGQIYKHLK